MFDFVDIFLNDIDTKCKRRAGHTLALLSEMGKKCDTEENVVPIGSVSTGDARSVHSKSIDLPSTLGLIKQMEKIHFNQ